MKLLKIALLIFVTVAVNIIAYSQVPSLQRMKQVIDGDQKSLPGAISIKLINSTQAGILFKKNTSLTQSNVINWLTEKMALRQNDDKLVDEQSDVITNGFTAKKIHQYYKDIKVEHGVVNSTSLDGTVRMMQLEFYSVPDGFNTQPTLSEESALNKARAFVGAAVYAWDNPKDASDEDFQKPRGELVIIQNYKTDGVVCLAYKFNVYALEPMSRSYIYVNAWDGSIVLNDAIIKHAKGRSDEAVNTKNTDLHQSPFYKAEDEGQKILRTTAVNRTGTAATRYSGSRQIVTDSVAGPLVKPFRLRQGRDNHAIITLDFQRKPHNTNVNFEAQAVEFNDNDNNWTSAEFNNTNLDDAALDAHYNMQWVSDYWVNVHQRKGWDDKDGAFIGYVHTSEDEFDQNGVFVAYKRWFDNAFWNGKNMHFGDGNGLSSTNTDYDPPATSLDDCGHELSHAITTSTSGLVYRWESGAMNEAFSDIWAACITNYAVQHDPTLSGEQTWRLFEKSTKPNKGANAGLRDMQDPTKFNDPSTYHSTHWTPGDYSDCPVESDNVNDHCGVHHNSGVLNKWFFLITQGEIGINSKLDPYVVLGLGFATTEKIAYLMELNLTPNAGYANAMTVSLNATATAYGLGSQEYNTVKAAWAAVGLDTANTFNMANTPVFTTNNFTCITVASDNNVFAGTNYNGFYQYDGTDWIKRNELLDVRFNDIKTDMIDGDLWIAQSGRIGTQGGGSSIAGGVNRLKYPYDAPTSTLYTVDPLLHVPSRNARCMFIDDHRLIESTNPKAWVATAAYITSNQSTSGMLGVGFHSTYKEFVPVSEGINIGVGTLGCLTVGGNRKEVWTFVQANNGINQLLSYNAETNALITTYDHNSTPIIPSGFVARAIYGDRYQRIWIGLANAGILIYDENKVWHYVNFTTIFPPGVQVNYNAITGNKHGDIFIGTSAGMVYFDAGGGWANRLSDSLYYRRYGKANGLMSDNINAIAYDDGRFKLWVASDSGIVIWDPPCIGAGNCLSTPMNKNGFSVTKRSGNWSDTAVWDSGLIPDSTTVVVINDTIAVDINGQCQSLKVANPGNLKVNTGKNLAIFEEKEPILTNERRRRRR